MKKVAAGLAAVFFLCGGCSILPKSDFSTSAEKSVQAANLNADETKTLAGLSEIEEALRDYYAHERRIPDSLDALIPQYLAEIPTVELGLPEHRDTNRVTDYNPAILIDGVVDGARIGDTGGWGYVHTDRQVVVFVDCTHLSPNGTPWYTRQP
ncbi:MAG: hypothetical protein KGL04_06195 [Elusimicrobia bacterium]|nr:hypothetical protein [Elusimicrobiota bacterium]MDE2313745.1 hypothetical protein [Elusimicrobiota bacterium]